MGIERFIPTRRFELNQRKNIQRIADEILKVLKHYWDSPFEIPNILNQIANSPLFKKFTDSIAKKLLSDTIIFNNIASSQSFTDNFTAVNNRRKFFEQQYYSKSLRIFKNLKNDAVLQEFINNKVEEKSDLFKTIPKDLAEHIVPLINQWNVQGLTSKQMSKEKLQGQISDLLDWQVRRIARTETSKTSVDIIEFKSKKCNVPCYFWRASGGSRGDGRTRDSHKKMADVIVFWNDPPAPEDLFPIYGENGKKYKNTLGNYHAGCCPNCRCVPSPVIFKDDLKFPVRVYTNGKIVSMQKPEFDNLYNSRISQMKAELQREKEQVEQKKANVASANNELESKRKQAENYGKEIDNIGSKIESIQAEIKAEVEKESPNIDLLESKQNELKDLLNKLQTIEEKMKQFQSSLVTDSAFVRDDDLTNKINQNFNKCKTLEEHIKLFLIDINNIIFDWIYHNSNKKEIEEIQSKTEKATNIPVVSYLHLPKDVAEKCDEFIQGLYNDKTYRPFVEQMKFFGSLNDGLYFMRNNYFDILENQNSHRKNRKTVIKEISIENIYKNSELFVPSINQINQELTETASKSQGIYINPDIFMNIKNLEEWEEKSKKKNEKNFIHPENCHTLEAKLNHELFHFLDNILHLSTDTQIIRYINQYKNSIGNDLGYYAEKSKENKKYREVIAEAWSDFRINKGKAKEISKNIGNRIIEMIDDFNNKQGGKNNG